MYQCYSINRQQQQQQLEEIGEILNRNMCNTFKMMIARRCFERGQVRNARQFGCA